MKINVAVAEAVIVVGAGVFLVVFVATFGVDVPYYDEWRLVPGLLRARDEGFAAFAPLAQYEDSFLPVLKGAMWALTLVDGCWRPQLQMFLGAGCLEISLCLVVALLRRRLPPSPLRLLAVAVVAMIIVSPAHHEPLLWGLGLIHLLPLALLLGAVVVQERWRRASWPLGALAAVIACGTFSVGPLLLCCAIPWWRSRKEPLWAASTAAVLVLCAAGLWAFTPPEFGNTTAHSHDSSLWRMIQHGLSATSSSLVGAAVWPFLVKAPRASVLLLPLAAAVGVAMVTLAAVGLATSRQARSAPAALALFSLLACGAIGWGRAGEGPAQAFSSRYGALTLTLPVAVVLVWAGRSRWVLVAIGCAAVGNGAAGLVTARAWREARQQGRASLALLEACPTQRATRALDPAFSPEVARAVIARRLLDVASAGPLPARDSVLNDDDGLVEFLSPNWLTPTFQKPTSLLARVHVEDQGVAVAVLRRADGFRCLGAGDGDFVATFADVEDGGGTFEVWTHAENRWRLRAEREVVVGLTQSSTTR